MKTYSREENKIESVLIDLLNHRKYILEKVKGLEQERHGLDSGEDYASVQFIDGQVLAYNTTVERLDMVLNALAISSEKFAKTLRRRMDM